MRENLKNINEIRDVFTGVFERYGTKNGFKKIEKTILLKNIKDRNNNIITDHLWFNYTKGFKNLGELEEGDLIEFVARVKKYEKGYKGYRNDVYKPIEKDYKLSHPTKIKILK